MKSIVTRMLGKCLQRRTDSGVNDAALVTSFPHTNGQMTDTLRLVQLSPVE